MEKSAQQSSLAARASLAAQAAYLAVWLSACWNLALFGHMGRLGLVPGAAPESLSIIDVLLLYKEAAFVILALHVLALHAARVPETGVPDPGTKRVLAAGAGMLLAALPTPLSPGHHLYPSVILLLAAGVCCSYVPGAHSWAHRELRVTHGVLVGAVALFLCGSYLARVRPDLARRLASADAIEFQAPKEDPRAAFVAEIPRHDPAIIDALPPRVVRELQAARCLVTQSRFENDFHNFMSAELSRPGVYDWAVLCSKGEKSYIRVVWQDPAVEGVCGDSIAPEPDINYIQDTGEGQRAYSRTVGMARPGMVTKALGDAVAADEQIHAGIEDRYVGQGIRVHYCREGKWLSATLPWSAAELESLP